MPIAADEVAITAWLESVPNRERTGQFRDMQLEGVQRLLELLPPVPRPCTVAGTKGKGSVVRLMEFALVAAGQSTVSFSSPHVHSVLERWRVDGRPAEPAIIAACCDAVAVLEQQHALKLTYYERTFAIACLLASRRPGTRFLLEVGLGGRLDCANALDAEVAVITHLSHDHRDVLGPTLHHIAGEKAAICRPDAAVIIAPQSPVAALALWRQIARFRTPAYNGSTGTRTLRINVLPKPTTVWVQPPRHRFHLALLGAHQQENAATAAAALRAWMPNIASTAIADGFAQATLPARCELREDNGRRVLIDGAHNRESISATLAVARQVLGPSWCLIIGIARDKELAEICDVLPRDRRIVRCGYQSPRACAAQDWPQAAQRWPWFPSVQEALATVPADADVCITGSFYLAAEV